MWWLIIAVIVIIVLYSIGNSNEDSNTVISLDMCTMDDLTWILKDYEDELYDNNKKAVILRKGNSLIDIEDYKVLFVAVVDNNNKIYSSAQITCERISRSLKQYFNEENIIYLRFRSY